jgi:5-formyltetrahydrofolate cyclo-ligase
MTAQAGSVTSTSSPAIQTERSALRRYALNARRALSTAYRKHAAQQLALQFDRFRLLKPKLRIGLYLATPHEINLNHLITRAQNRHCTLYVPHIVNYSRRQMRFVQLFNTSRLQRHALGMQQISGNPRQHIQVQQLDLVLVPTVAFDAQGHRLGMGAGFYDRHFAYLRYRRWQRPRLIGVAYRTQQVVYIPTYTHDISLPHVMTEHGLMDCQ